MDLLQKNLLEIHLPARLQEFISKQAPKPSSPPLDREHAVLFSFPRYPACKIHCLLVYSKRLPPPVELPFCGFTLSAKVSEQGELSNSAWFANIRGGFFPNLVCFDFVRLTTTNLDFEPYVAKHFSVLIRFWKAKWSNLLRLAPII